MASSRYSLRETERSLGARSTIPYILDAQYPVADGIAETISSGTPVESSLPTWRSQCVNFFQESDPRPMHQQVSSSSFRISQFSLIYSQNSGRNFLSDTKILSEFLTKARIHAILYI